jgi:hypothetical protein
MLHIAAKTLIYETRHYDRFVYVRGNRNINKKKVERIIHEIANGNDILAYCPILVSEKGDKLEINDGQHRKEVSQLLKRPVYYIISPSMSMAKVAQVNSNQEKWKKGDFMRCYIEQGNEHYQKLQSFIEEYNCPFTSAVKLLIHGVQISDGGLKGMHKFERGQFEVKKYKQAVEVMEACELFKLHKGYKTSAFITAISCLITEEKVDLIELAKEFQKNPSKLIKTSNPKVYLVYLNAIYNGSLKNKSI